MTKNIKKYFLFHLGIVIVLCAILYTSFFATLHWVTRHGEELKIPDVRGKDLNTAIAKLKGMHFEVSVDSIYEPEVKPMSVLKQVPDTGSSVKEGRTVFLTVNMLTPPHIPMPNLVNLSFRSAEMLLRNNKLILGDTTYVPDIAAGAIKQQLFNGQDIRPGEMIAQGSKINLVIGNGLGNTEFDMPDVTGRSVDEAQAILAQYNLQPIVVPFDQRSVITDTSTAIIVDQRPRAFNDAGVANRVKAGEIIDLSIEQNPSAQDIHDNTNTHNSVNNDDSKKKPGK
ncbi:MAG: PASTA domain-containing protein [Chitinophagales bacterium]